MVLAANLWKDTDFTWLSLQPYDFVIMTKTLPEGTPNNLVHNVGHDAGSYLQFILEHWDHLPERMLFSHGHRRDWHLPGVRTARCRAALACL